VEADHVTIDLNGFMILGLGSGNGRGIVSDKDGITISNGTISNFGLGALLIGDGCTVRGIRAIDNGGGLSLGRMSNVKDCTVIAIDVAGIWVADQSLVNSSTSITAGGIGINANTNCVVTGCYGEGDLIGIAAFGGSTISNNTAKGGTNGLYVFCASNIIGNTGIGPTPIHFEGANCNSSNNVEVTP
jgi:hypothetical protein